MFKRPFILDTILSKLLMGRWWSRPSQTRTAPKRDYLVRPPLSMKLPRALFQGSKTQERENRTGKLANWRIRRMQEAA